MVINIYVIYVNDVISQTLSLTNFDCAKVLHQREHSTKSLACWCSKKVLGGFFFALRLLVF